jgi:cytochrome b561
MSQNKYDKIAIILHWLIATSFITMLVSGLVMANLDIPRSLKFSIYQWHKSLGLLTLILVIIRIAWRLTHTPPKLPNSINKREQKLAKFGHLSLYFWMLILPLSGWIMVSSSIYGLPTIIFGWFEWPHLPYLSANKNINNISNNIHITFAFSLIALILVHIAAVLKHYLKEQENLLKRIWF